MPKPVAVIANGLQQKQILGGGGTRRSVSQQILQAQANTGSTALLGDPVRLVAVENITLSGAQTVDGVSDSSDGTRILAAGQSTPSENGVYVYNSGGAWPRASDTIRAGTMYEILEGTDYANRQAVCTNDTDPNIGTDNITFLVRNPVGGSGTAGKLPYWADTLVLGDSVVEQDSDNIGIGMTPTVKLDVNGTVRATGLTVDIASAETGRVLTALDSTGAAVWSDLPGGTVTGTGTAAYIALWTDTDEIANSVIEENAGNIGIDMTPTVKLDVNGTVRSTGLTVDIASADAGRVLTALDSTGAAVWSDLPASGGGSISGSGTAGYIPLWSDTTVLTDSVIEQNSGKLGIGISSPTAKLHMYDGTNTIRFGADTGAHMQMTVGANKGGISITRNITGATSQVLLVQDSHSGSFGDAIRGQAAGTGSGVEGVSTGSGIGVYGETVTGYGGYFTTNGGDGYSLYVSRSYSSATKPVAFFQETSSSPHPVVRIKHLGSTKPLEVVNNTTTVFNILSNNNTEILGGLLLGKVRTITTSPATIQADECVIFVDTSSTAISLTMPAVAVGRIVTIKDKSGNAFTNNITVNRAGSALIDGNTSWVMEFDNEARIFISDGTNWYIHA